MGYGGVGEQGGGFGGEADTGGVAEGSSGNSSSGGGRGGNLGSEMGTVGPGQGYGSGHSSTDGNAGGGGRGSGTSNNGYGDTFGDSLDARSAAPEAKAGSSMTGTAAMVSMDDAAKEAKAVFGGWATQADTQLGPENVGYGNAAYGGNGAIANASQAAAMTRDQHTQSLEMAGIPESHHAAARPSALAKGLSFAATVANPVAGLLGTALSTHSAAKNAQTSIGAINDAFGTSLDSSYGTALGQQAVGTAAGTLGGKVGGNFGAKAGMSVAGVPGAVLGGLLGAATLGNTARGLAMGPNTNTEGPQGPAAGADGDSGLSNAPSSAVASASSTPKSGYVSIDNYAMDSDRNPFDRYSDYAAQFFGTA